MRVRQRGGMDKRRKEILLFCTPLPFFALALALAPAPPRTTRRFLTLFSAARSSASCYPAAVSAHPVRYVLVLVDVQLR